MNYTDHTELLEEIATQQELNALQAASTALQMAEHILERQSFATLKRLEAMFPMPKNDTASDELSAKQAAEHYDAYTGGTEEPKTPDKKTTKAKKTSTTKK